MLVYRHAAEILRQTQVKNQGFKTAFYDYLEANKRSIGSLMSKVYSVAINVYKRIGDIERAMGQALSAEHVKDQFMLMVLIHEGAIKNEKLKIGGKLSSMVKRHKEELQQLLGREEEQKSQVYVRLNRHLTSEVRVCPPEAARTYGWCVTDSKRTATEPNAWEICCLE